MYFYHFSQYFWNDRVFKTPSSEIKAWDLCKNTYGDICLCLGEEISFQELYNNISNQNLEVIIPRFFSNKTIDFLHWMVYQRYTTYYATMECFVGNDIHILLKHQIKTKKTLSTSQRYEIQDNIIKKTITNHTGQHLILFPDQRTLHQYKKDISEEKSVTILSSNNTSIKKAKVFREIKQWNISTLICTHSQIFQDWRSLTHITCVHPEKRYYKNQQDPRYHTKDVIEQLSTIHKATITYIL